MLHFVPVPQVDESPEPYADALARLASIRHALRLVDPFGGGPASDPSDDDRIAARWSEASTAESRCFDSRTERTAGAAAAGLDALLGERAAGRQPNEAASRQLAEEIRRGLEDVSRLMLRGA
ncbi:hypothetical protein [Sphingomonas sp.]|uniref:hypothetical protein n=1 Tax=Sphingomonas sp. TaxID=28214 RepID=UPI0017A6A964|nr:hypothetical protein [Sphingomonas sp.]MBA3510722.1 hypothetical protein [Sphingomonas sp.]